MVPTWPFIPWWMHLIVIGVVGAGGLVLFCVIEREAVRAQLLAWWRKNPGNTWKL